MIDGMLISSFKGFPAPWNYLPIRPITLIFGPNAAGKSTLLQALAWASHIHQGGAPDTANLKLTGDRINLGGFRRFITRTDLYGSSSPLEECGEAIGLGFGFRLPWPIQSSEASSWIMADGQSTPAPGWYVMYEIKPDGIECFNILAGAIPMQWIKDGNKYKFGGFDISSGLQVNRQDENSSTIIQRELIQKYLIGLNNNTDVNGLTQEWYFEFCKYLKSTLEDSTLYFNGLCPVLSLTENFSGRGPEEAQEFMSNLRAAVIQIGDEIHAFLSNFGYLGPWRQIPSLEALASTREGLTSTELLLWDLVREDDGIRADLNQWIGKFNSNLEFGIRDLLNREDVLEILLKASSHEYTIQHHFNPATNLMVSTQEEMTELERWEKNLSQATAGLKSLPPAQRRLVLRLAPSNIEISAGNTGVGISQLVPVLVAALNQDPKNWLIEQPELHLHPKAQALLGDLFIRGAMAGRTTGQCFIIETHSEHMILRVLRRIRETYQMFEKNDFPVHPEEVAVSYVGRMEHEWLLESMKQILTEPDYNHLDIDDETDRTIIRTVALKRNQENDMLFEGNYLDFLQVSTSRIIPIPITPGGDFEIEWPGGFFEERLDELLSADEVKLWRTKQSGGS